MQGYERVGYCWAMLKRRDEEVVLWLAQEVGAVEGQETDAQKFLSPSWGDHLFSWVSYLQFWSLDIRKMPGTTKAARSENYFLPQV